MESTHKFSTKRQRNRSKSFTESKTLFLGMKTEGWLKYTMEDVFRAVILLTHMENYNRGYHYSTIRTVL